MEEKVWKSADGKLEINTDGADFHKGKEHYFIATHSIASASLKKTENSMMFFGGFTVSLIGLVLFSFGLPKMAVAGVIGLGVVLFLLSLLLKKTVFEIASTGGDRISMGMGKNNKESIEEAIALIRELQSNQHQEVRVAQPTQQPAASAAPSTTASATPVRKSFREGVPRKS